MFFLIILIAAGLGFLMTENPGTVVITYGHWMMSTRFWTAVVACILFFLVLFFVLKILKSIINLPSIISNRFDINRVKKQREYAAAGYCEYTKGDYAKAEKYFIKSAENNAYAYLDYLKAAKAAQKIGDIKRRDLYLQKAAACDNKDDLVVLITEARLKIKNKEYDNAALILKSLQAQYPKNKVITQSLNKIYLATTDGPTA